MYFFPSFAWCQWLVCRSRAATPSTVLVKTVDPASLMVRDLEREVNLCPEHERWVAQNEGLQLNLSAEGSLYHEVWLVAPLFTAWG